MPSWSPDGESIYYIQTTDARGTGRLQERRLQERPVRHPGPRPHAGPGRRQRRTGAARHRHRQGRPAPWVYWMRQPVLSPDGKTIAMVTDAPNPEESNVVLQFFDLGNEEVDGPASRRRACSATRTPSGGPTASTCCTSRTAATGRAARRSIVRYDTRRRRPARSPARATCNRRTRRTAGTSRRPGRPRFGTDVVILDANDRRELLRITNDGASWAPAWSPAGDGIAFLHIDGQIVDLQLARLDGIAPGLDGQGDDRADRGLRPRRRVAAGLVHPGATCCRRHRPPTPVPTPHRPRPPPARRRDRPAVTTTYLERLGGTVRGGRHGPVPRARPRPGRLAGRVLARPGRHRAVRDAARSRRPGRIAAAVKPNLAFFEASASAGMAALERIRARMPGRPPGRRRREARRHRLDGGAPGGRPVRRPRGGRGHRQPVPRAPRRSRRSSSARTGSPTSCAGRRTRVPASSRTWSSPRTRRSARRRSRSTVRVAPRARRAGARAGRSGSSSARRRPAELRRDPGRRPGPGVPRARRRRPGRGHRAGPRARSGDGRAGRPARAGGGLLVNVSRGIAGAALDGPDGGPRRPVRASRGGRRRLGRAPPCATLAAAADPPFRQEHRRSCRPPDPLELVIILVIALLILGPGKLPEVGAALGKSIREFRKASSDVQDAVKVDTSPTRRRRRPPSRPHRRPRACASTDRGGPGCPAVPTTPPSGRAPASRRPARN